jgi:hypothetical protein
MPGARVRCDAEATRASCGGTFNLSAGKLPEDSVARLQTIALILSAPVGLIVFYSAQINDGVRATVPDPLPDRKAIWL